jgi:hypothetical protein
LHGLIYPQLPFFSEQWLNFILFGAGYPLQGSQNAEMTRKVATNKIVGIIFIKNIV